MTSLTSTATGQDPVTSRLSGNVRRKPVAFSIAGQLREKIGLAPFPPGEIWAKHRSTLPLQAQLSAVSIRSGRRSLPSLPKIRTTWCFAVRPVWTERWHWCRHRL